MRLRSTICLLAALLAAAPATATVSDYEIVSGSTPSDSTSPKSLDVLCPVGTTPLGGGGLISGNITGKALVTSQVLIDLGSGDAIGWTVQMQEMLPSANNWSLVVRAACASVEGAERVGGATASDSNSSKSLDLACSAGKVAIAGGYEIGGAADGVGVHRSAPMLDAFDAPIGWRLGAYEFVDTAGNWSLRGHVLCADLDVFLFHASTRPDNIAIRGATLECPAGYVATGGGASLSGTVQDWISSSAPASFDGSSWSTTNQRDPLDTADSTLAYDILCPEPAAPWAVALASLGLHPRALRRRFRAM
jgi:hypothetical protein